MWLVGFSEACKGAIMMCRPWMRFKQACLTAGRMRRLQRSTLRNMQPAKGTSCATGKRPPRSTHNLLCGTMEPERGSTWGVINVET